MELYHILVVLLVLPLIENEFVSHNLANSVSRSISNTDLLLLKRDYNFDHARKVMQPSSLSPRVGSTCLTRYLLDLSRRVCLFNPELSSTPLDLAHCNWIYAHNFLQAGFALFQLATNTCIPNTFGCGVLTSPRHMLPSWFMYELSS